MVKLKELKFGQLMVSGTGLWLHYAWQPASAKRSDVHQGLAFANKVVKYEKLREPRNSPAMLSVFHLAISSAASRTASEMRTFPRGLTATTGLGPWNSFFAIWVSMLIHLL